jgi:branched-subunit amino acid ABC-type transport system permease component
MDIFTQQLINGLVLGSIYALVALGYTMVYGILELINFAHGEVTMIGAMVALTVIGVLDGRRPGPARSFMVVLRWHSHRNSRLHAARLRHREDRLPAIAQSARVWRP